MHYQLAIAKAMNEYGIPPCADLQARHVEAWIRIEIPTLDHLSMAELKEQVFIALGCALAEPVTVNERLAASLGL